MSQIFFKLLVCFLLTNSVTAQYSTDPYHGVKQFSTGQASPYNPGYSDERAFYNTLLENYPQLWIRNTGSPVNTQQPVQTIVKQEPATSKATPIQRDRNDNIIVRGPSSNIEYSNVIPYAEPTGPPHGLRSTGEILIYKPEKLNLTKCGPQPTSNPCKIFDREYHPLPGYPECYIQCAFGRMFVKPCPTDLAWNDIINVCDWKTIATVGSDSEGRAVVYDNRIINQDIRDSYKRGPRATIERKKRNLQYGSQQNQESGVAQNNQFPKSNTFNMLRLLTKPMNVPLTPVYLPGPVSFQHRYGIPSLSMPTAASQQFISPSTTPEAAPPSGADQYTQQFYHPYGQYGAEFGHSYPAAASTNITETPAASGIPPSTTSDWAQQSETVNERKMFPQAPMSNILSGDKIRPEMLHRNPTSFYPYAAPNPISTQVTLIPGPLYPYGPPYGGPFGSKPSKQSRAHKSASANTGKFNGKGNVKNNFDSVQTSSFGTANKQPDQSSPYDSLSAYPDIPLNQIMNDPKFEKNKALLAPYIEIMKKFNLFKDHELTPTKNAGSSLDNSDSYDEDDDDYDDDEDVGDTDDVDNDEDNHDYEDEEQYDDYDDEVATDENSDDYNEDTTTDAEEESDEEYEDEETSKENSELKKNNYLYQIFFGRPPKKPFGSSRFGPSSNRRKRQYSPSTANYEQKPSHLRRKRASENEATPRPALFSLSPCLTKPPESYTAHPTDPTKYVACFNQFYYQIMNCPNSLIYNSNENICEKRKGLESFCEREKPCKNDGLCYQTGPKSFKCTCRGDWTGEQCEIPLSACINKPCGQGNECITIKASNVKQDYVCVCNKGQSYGLNCEQNVRPNPCLSSTNEQEQYYPFAFSSQVFIQCNGDILYVQSCPSGLHWNASQQVCDVAVTQPPVSDIYRGRTFGKDYIVRRKQPTIPSPQMPKSRSQSMPLPNNNQPSDVLRLRSSLEDGNIQAINIGQLNHQN